MSLLPDPSLARLPEPRRTWYRRVFYAAAVYNLLWGLGVIFMPLAPFRLLGLPDPDPLGTLFWQCIGMFVMVFAIGYYYAGREPERYAPFILIGTLGKIFGPIGFLYGWLWLGAIPGEVGFTILTNDLLWYPAFIPFVVETFFRRRPAGSLPSPGRAGGIAA